MEIPVSYQVTDQDVFGSLFGAQPDLANPRVSLRVKIAKTRAEQMRERRAIDKATLPYVEQDIVESEKRQQDITASIDRAMEALKAPPPTQQTGFNDAEVYAGTIGGLLSGGQNLPDILNALAQASGARNKMEFEDKLRQYGLNRESVVIGLKQLQSMLEDEAQTEREMRRANVGAQQNFEQRQDSWDRMFSEYDLRQGEQDQKREWDVQDRDAELASKERIAAVDLELEKIKERVAAAKDKVTAQNQAVDDFRQAVAAQFSGADISQDDANELNDQAEALTAALFPGYGTESYDSPEANAFRSRLLYWSPRTNVAQQFRRMEFNAEKPLRDARLQGEILNNRAKRQKESDRANAPAAAEITRGAVGLSRLARTLVRGGLTPRGAKLTYTGSGKGDASLKPQAGSDYQKWYDDTKKLIEAAKKAGNKQVEAEARQRFKDRFGVDFK